MVNIHPQNPRPDEVSAGIMMMRVVMTMVMMVTMTMMVMMMTTMMMMTTTRTTLRMMTMKFINYGGVGSGVKQEQGMHLSKSLNDIN